MIKTLQNKIFIVLLSLGAFVILSTTFPIAKNNSFYVESGVIDLNKWNVEDKGIIALNGEWEFYWRELLEPEDFQHYDVKPHYVYVPNLWAAYEIEGQQLSSQGYATYRLTFLLPDERIQPGTTLALYYETNRNRLSSLG